MKLMETETADHKIHYITTTTALLHFLKELGDSPTIKIQFINSRARLAAGIAAKSPELLIFDGDNTLSELRQAAATGKWHTDNPEYCAVISATDHRQYVLLAMLLNQAARLVEYRPEPETDGFTVQRSENVLALT